MINMTWRDLQIFLNQNSSNGDIMWDRHVIVHNAETGDEYPCDTWILSNNNINRLVLVINQDSI